MALAWTFSLAVVVVHVDIGLVVVALLVVDVDVLFVVWSPLYSRVLASIVVLVVVVGARCINV